MEKYSNTIFKTIYKLMDMSDQLGKYNKSLNRFIQDNREMLQKLITGEEVSASEFLKIYDERVYDVHSRQNDIKFMKQMDFEGLYYIKNLSAKKYYIGRGNQVFRKVDRHFRGFGVKEIFEDFEKNDKFNVGFRRFAESGYDNLDDYEKEIRDNLKLEFAGYECYGMEKVNPTPAERHAIDRRLMKRVAKKSGRKLWMKRWKAFLLHGKRIALDDSVTEFVGMTYGDAVAKMIANGFVNIEAIAIRDVEGNGVYEPEEVEKVIINGKSQCLQGERIPYDAIIEIVYHLKKEIEMPYSSKQVKKRDCKALLKEFKDIGFKVINLIAVEDLITGWLVKDGSVEKVIINRQEDYKKGQLFEYDAKIDIYYHTSK